MMAETFQPAMAPYVAMAAVGLASYAWTAARRSALVVKTVAAAPRMFIASMPVRGQLRGIVERISTKCVREVSKRTLALFIIAVHRAFVLGLGARHRGIVELSEDRCV